MALDILLFGGDTIAMEDDMPRVTGRGRLRQCVCAQCGREYETRGATVYCSRECGAYAAARHRRLPRVSVRCRRCGRVFEVIGSKAKAYAVRLGRVRGFCTKACYD